MNTTLRLTSLTALALALAGTAMAQSKNTQAFLGTATDTDPGNPITFAGDFSNSGDFVSVEDAAGFSGLDGNGDLQNSFFSGTGSAQANYGSLKASASGNVDNTFYNPDNAANGDPSLYIAVGQAQAIDTLTFNATAITPTWRVKYVFFITGRLEGSEGYAALSTTINDEFDFTFIDTPVGQQIAQYWATPTYELDTNFSHELKTNLLVSFSLDTRFYADGSTVTGSANFGSTAELVGIEMYDDLGNRVYDFNVTSASGHNYAVPEPASMTALGLGLLALARRRRKA